MSFVPWSQRLTLMMSSWYVHDINTELFMSHQTPHYSWLVSFQTKEAISNDIKESLSHSMNSFGLEIIATPVTDIDPEHKVKAAMNEVSSWWHRHSCDNFSLNSPFFVSLRLWGNKGLRSLLSMKEEWRRQWVRSNIRRNSSFGNVPYSHCLCVAAIKKAEAEAEAIRISAEAEAEANYLRGVGTARQRRAVSFGPFLL